MAEKKDVSAVASGKKRPRSAKAKFSDIFMPEDMSVVKDHLINDVAVPTIKDTILDVVSLLLYGTTTTPNRKKSSNGLITNYNAISTARKSSSSPSVNKKHARAAGYAYDEIIFDSRGEAEEVLDNMFELLTEYGIVSVMDYYDLAGVSTKHTDQNYGWDDLSSAVVKRISRDEHIIDLPRVIAIN